MKLSAHLRAVRVHRSRSQHERHYKLFACSNGDMLELTLPVAQVAKLPYDEVRKTLCIRGDPKQDDARAIADQLQRLTDWHGTVTIA